jgi:protein subunit release factor B
MMIPADPTDSRNTVVEIRAGTGGDEASLFASDLYRMYCRYADSRGWKVENLSMSESPAGGFKEICFLLSGDDVYRSMKYECGTHRVQRVPVTEAAGRIHTSAATVAILPEAEEVDIHIDPNEIEISIARASGPGGQGVNTTDSAVQILHKPTGMIVKCADERSQLKNKTKESLNNPVITHNLYDEWNDRLLGQLKYHNLDNIKNQHVKIIFVPCYLTGNDGIFNMSYYDLLIGFDLTVFPSYYEPWGYTPLESVAFSIPTITTSLSGFGSWVNKKSKSIDGGVAVIKRDDANYMEVANEIQTIIAAYSQKSDKEVDDSRKKAAAIAQKAQWENFIEYYQKAYSIALNKKIKK